MSDYVFSGFENFDVSHERKSSKKTSKVNLIKLFLSIFLLILFAEAIVYLFVIPSMQTVSISWSGLSHYSELEMNTAIQPVINKSWINFRSTEARSLISSVAGIEDVQIVKKFPDKVYINVIERSPVAMTFISVDERTEPVQIDKNGVLFNFPSEDFHVDRSIPLVSGIPVENIPEGMRIPVKYRGLLEQIAMIRELPQNYFAAISEIHVVPKEYGNYELVLYPIHKKIRILTGRQLNEESLKYMIVALDVVNMLDPDVEEIDLRYGSISYQKHHESSGVSFD